MPQQWPHLRAILERAGFSPGPRTEIALVADVDALDRPPAPLPGFSLARTLGTSGTRFTALLGGDRAVGCVEVENRIGDSGRLPRHDGWADVGNLWVAEPHRRRGVAGWLLGQAADWLRLGHVDRLLDYSSPDDEGYLAFLGHAGFRELTRTSREWQRPARPGGHRRGADSPQPAI